MRGRSVFQQRKSLLPSCRCSQSGMEKSWARQMVWHLAWQHSLSRFAFSLSLSPSLESCKKQERERDNMRTRNGEKREWYPRWWIEDVETQEVCLVRLVANTEEQDGLACWVSVVHKALCSVQFGWTSDVSLTCEKLGNNHALSIRRDEILLEVSRTSERTEEL